MVDALRQQVLAGGGIWVRLAPFPVPLSVPLSTSGPISTSRFPKITTGSPLTRSLLADCCTHFVSTHAYANEAEVLSDLRRHDTQSHGHFHYVYRDPEANRGTWSVRIGCFASAGFEPEGFAAPARALESRAGRRRSRPGLPILIRLPARL